MFFKVFDLLSPHTYGLCSLADLVAGSPRRLATLDLKQRVIHRGPESYRIDQIESLHLFPVYLREEQREAYFLGLKLILGTVFCFERQTSREATESLAKSIARRLQLAAPQCRTLPSSLTYETLATLQKGRIVGGVSLSGVRFTETGVILPLGLCVEDEVHVDGCADLLIDRKVGFVLYDGLGRSQAVAEFSRFRALKSESRMIAMHSSEHTLLTLRFILEGPPRIELSCTYGTIHDDPIAGEVAEARREAKELGAIVTRLKKHLTALREEASRVEGQSGTAPDAAQ